jgi:glucans biosynthesis protein C
MNGTAGRPGRIAFVSRYRGFLITLVVLIHTSITYGASGSWYFSEPHDVVWVKIAGSLIGSLAQSFALGAFFFLSAYFLPGSLDRRGIGPVLRDRLMRLGIPFVLFYFIANPLLVMAVSSWGEGHPLGFGPWFGSGPLWFVEVLFVFTLVYAAARLICRRAPGKPVHRGPPGRRAVILYIVVAAALGFAARVFFPIGWAVSNLQLGFFPMYIILFAVGLRAGRGEWLANVGFQRIGVWVGIAAAGIILYPVVLIGGGALRDVAPFLGGLTWQSAVYALWEAATGTGLFISTLVLFARARWRETPVGNSFSESSYGVYVLHAALIILLALAMQGVPVHPAVKWIILSVFGVCGSWGLTEALRLIPGVSRVL